MGQSKPFAKDDLEVIFIDMQNLWEAITEVVLVNSKEHLNMSQSYYKIVDGYRKSQQGIRMDIWYLVMRLNYSILFLQDLLQYLARRKQGLLNE